MSKRRISGSALPWAGLVLLWGTAFVLACRLTSAVNEPGDRGGAGIVELLFGESRRALSAGLYERADTYFHKGVEHFEKKAFTNTAIQRLLADIAPEAHVHATGQSAAEIVPWLKLSTEADPHNVDAFLVASYWLATQLRRPDAAQQVLIEAQRLNPNDYRILLEKGRLALRTQRFKQAEDALDAALACWPSGMDPQDRQALLDKAEIFTYRAFLCELAGHLREAADLLKKVLAIFPERTYIAKRVASLESGQHPPGDALQMLHGLFERPDHHVCDQGKEEQL